MLPCQDNATAVLLRLLISPMPATAGLRRQLLGLTERARYDILSGRNLDQIGKEIHA
jgi:hypothetical protein